MDTSVIDLPAPVAARLRRPGWRDPRLLAGIAMVAASVLLGSWAVRSAQATVPVYVTRRALVPGDRVAVDELAVVDVRLGHREPGALPAGGRAARHDDVVVRAVGRGELVPAYAVGSAADLDLRPVAIPLRARPRATSRSAPWSTSGSPRRPRTATRRRRSRDSSRAGSPSPRCAPSGAFRASGGSSVHVLVPTDVLPEHPHRARGRRRARRGARARDGWLT